MDHMLWVSVALAVVLLTANLVAQNPAPSADSRPAFDVTSVKSYKGAETAMSNRFTPGQTRYANVPLSVLIQTAYGVAGYQVVDAPSWVESERWDVIGTASTVDTRAQAGPLMQRLLEDRFA